VLYNKTERTHEGEDLIRALVSILAHDPTGRSSQTSASALYGG
jgi:hypothetical protein